MPVGSFGKWLVLGTLVAAIGATGCKEDDGETPPADTGTPGPVDSGGPVDAGTADTGPKDSGSPADTGPVDAGISCGSPAKVCTAHVANAALPPFLPGCAKDFQDAEVCGIASATVTGDAGGPPFLQKDAPGVASESCGAFLESKIEMPQDAGPDAGDAGIGNKLIDTKRTINIGGTPLEVFLVYPGCCTPTGLCSGDTAKGTSLSSLGGVAMSNGGFGCLEPKYFLNAAPAALQAVPCDPTTGVIKAPSSDGGTDAGGDAGPTDGGADAGNG